MSYKFPPRSNELFWNQMIDYGKAKTDGCSGVPEFHQHACFAHDWCYRRGTKPTLDAAGLLVDGTLVTRAEADEAFRVCIQESSKLGKFSPMSWWRWVGVRAGGWWGWSKRNVETTR